jgi:CRP-like cAMP-binding protein
VKYRQEAGSNQILRHLSIDERESLQRYGARLELFPNQVLQEAGDALTSVYFPYAGLISLLVVMPTGSIAEAGFVGSEGAVGTIYDVNERVGFTRAVVSSGGHVLRVPIDHFEHVMSQSVGLRGLISQNNNRIAQRGQQLAACNLLHQLEARVCRWLLQIMENSEDTTVVITQGSLAQMLGVNRARLNEALKTLHEIEAITQPHRGVMKVIDVNLVAERVCDCYRALHGSAPKRYGSNGSPAAEHADDPRPEPVQVVVRITDSDR